MKIHFYYNDGRKESVEGTIEELQEKARQFEDHPDCSFRSYHDNHEFTPGKGWHEVEDKPFRLYWLTGETEVIYGPTIEQAFNRKFGGGAIRALDWYDTKVEQTQDWDPKARRWVPREPVFDPNRD
jgi:hypothetical protein